MKFYLTILLFVVNLLSFAQFTDDFTDGDFTSAPVWSGQSANFEVDGLNQLHLNAPAVTDTSYLSLSSGSIDNAVWEFYVELDFNPSSSNLARIYLVSDNADLKGSLNGYFVLVGSSDDEVSLYRQDGLATTKIIDGVDGTVGVSLVTVRIQVTRDAVGNWELLADNTGGTTYVSEGTIFDNTYISSSYFGVFCKYTSTRSDKFFYDDFQVTGTPFVDAIAPLVNAVTVISSTELDIEFNEDVEQTTAETLSNYSVDNGIGSPSISLLDGANFGLVHLTFATPFVNGTTYDLTINNVEDLASNPILSPSNETFYYFIPEAPIANDVIITEIIGDPSPVVGLPEVDFIEIYNRSNKFFDLNNWSIEDEVSGIETFGSYVLAPGEYVVICDVDSMANFGISNVIGITSFPGFNNANDAVVLKDDMGNVIDSVYYFSSWYNDDVKDDGGWTLERKHLDAPCSDQNNWGASIDVSGGTPGIQNSIWTDVDDISLPAVSSYNLVNDTLLLVYFDEILDTTIQADITIIPNATLSWEWSDFSELQIIYNISTGIIYELTISNGSDCWGNEMNSTTITLGLPEDPEAEDLILNEVMFNPLTNGSDYVEIYNNSDKIIDLNGLYFANWDDDSISNFKEIIDIQYLVFPGDYVLVTEDTNDIINDFSIYGLGTFIETDLPTYNNDSGSVYLLAKDSSILDYFHYEKDYHYALVSDEDGKSLERISFDGGMNNADNWHTAAENVEWGTPGYENSQSFTPNTNGIVTIDPQLFSPDNDSYNDVLTINLNFETNDNVVDIRVYDNRGRMIRELKDNYFVGSEALITWDGSMDDNTKAPIGTYVILVSVLDENGNQSEYKLVCVLGGKL